MTKLSSRKVSKKLRKNWNTCPKKSLNQKKMKNKTLEMKNKKSSEESSERIWTDKRKHIIVSLKEEGNYKSLVNQVRLEPMLVMRLDPGLLSISVITMILKRTNVLRKLRKLLIDVRQLEKREKITQTAVETLMKMRMIEKNRKLLRDQETQSIVQENFQKLMILMIRV